MALPFNIQTVLSARNIEGYDIIGTLPNIYGAKPINLKDGNCFIIKKI